MANPQLDSRRRLIHLLTVEGVPRAWLTTLLDHLDRHAGAMGALAHDEPSAAMPPGGVPLLPRLVLAAAAPDADVVGAVALATRLLDGSPARQAPLTLHDSPERVARLAAPDEILVLNHPASGAAHAVAACAPSGLRVINVCDGWHAQPLAALADVAALRRRLPDLHTLRVALVGDLRRDARLRSVIHMLTTLGTPELRVLHTDGVVPEGAAQLGVHAYSTDERDAALTGADVVMTYAQATADQPAGLVMHGAPASQALGPPVAEPMTAVASLACALAAAVEGLVAS